MPHFHDFNPWASELAYIPDLEEFLELIPDEKTWVHPLEGTPFPARTRERYRSRIEAIGKYDLYVLEDGSAGVRVGKEGSQYLSPYVDVEKAKALWHKYTPAPSELTNSG